MNQILNFSSQATFLFFFPFPLGLGKQANRCESILKDSFKQAWDKHNGSMKNRVYKAALKSEQKKERMVEL